MRCLTGIIPAFFLLMVLVVRAQPVSLFVPAGGNSFVSCRPGQQDTVTIAGWEHWTDRNAVFSTYCKIGHAGTLELKVRLLVPTGRSLLRFSINGQPHLLPVCAGDTLADAGKWVIKKPGYLKITATGVSHTGKEFARVPGLVIGGTAVDSGTIFVKDNTGNYFYWGRRGPSVHINYITPAAGSITWFYSEIMVPPGTDPVGSYFMADGFAEGYFGIQVNSATERRVIFSVWSAFATDDPTKIPDSLRIRMVRKGPGVVAEDFGNEGSGGHSHLEYPWKAGVSYRFLLQALPDTANQTRFSAWFFDPVAARWLLVASFLRPGSRTGLTRLHAFLENFLPGAGDRMRQGYYFNQWVKPAAGEWLPIKAMHLTADATARKGFRADYNGGTANEKCFLSNGGFFNHTARLGTLYPIKNKERAPQVALHKLP